MDCGAGNKYNVEQEILTLTSKSATFLFLTLYVKGKTLSPFSKSVDIILPWISYYRTCPWVHVLNCPSARIHALRTAYWKLLKHTQTHTNSFIYVIFPFIYLFLTSSMILFDLIVFLIPNQIFFSFNFIRQCFNDHLNVHTSIIVYSF